jgi:hypothetical protein
MGHKLRAVVVSDGSQQAEIEPTDEHPFFCQFDPGRRLVLCNQDEVRACDPPRRRLLENATPDDCFELSWTFAPAPASILILHPLICTCT